MTFIIMCSTEAGEKYVKEWSSQRLHTVRMDVSNPASVEAALTFVKSKLPPAKGIYLFAFTLFIYLYIYIFYDYVIQVCGEY